MRILNSSQMKRTEQSAVAMGISLEILMENAGAAAVCAVLAREKTLPRHVLILAGKGNNGGDGFVAARLLADRGIRCTVLLADGEPVSPLCRNARERLKNRNVPVLSILGTAPACLPNDVDVVMDAIYGTGFHGRLSDTVRGALKWLESTEAIVYALDIPSGVHADTGQRDPDAVRAQVTIAFDSLKPAHVLEETDSPCGEICLVDIGVPPGCHPFIMPR